MKDFLLPLHRYFIPSIYWEDEEVLRKYRIFINASLLTSLFALFYIFIAYFFGMKHSIGMNVLSFVIFIVGPWLIKGGVKYAIATNLYIFQVLISSVWHAYFDGGLDSAVLPWICIAPVTAILFNNKKNAWYWVGAAITAIIFFIVWEMMGNKFVPEAYADLKNQFTANSYIGLILIIFLLAVVLDSAYLRSLTKLDKKNKEIEKEKERSDELLLNILPSEIADELKNKGYAEARQYDLVSVMFSDFVNFTSISEEMSARDLVDELNYFFKNFDQIITSFNLEKIKTIGDAYLATAGMNQHPFAGTKDIVQAALAMQQLVKERKQEREKENKPYFLMRIGIHTGPVVAGIVGVKKFAYDIWGDTVNTAARMEQSGEPGKVNISETTFHHIEDDFDCEYRGEIEAKHKGKLKMYFISHNKEAVKKVIEKQPKNA
jgi:adenylate cyclase